jgi:hypothetical protein
VLKSAHTIDHGDGQHGSHGGGGGASERRRSFTSRHTITEEEAKQLDEECMQRFIKVNCKIVTRSKGCFPGVLIITPSALMFDPLDNQAVNVRHKKIIEKHTAGGSLNASDMSNNSPRTTSSSGSGGNTTAISIYDEASAIIPIEIISNVIMYEDLALNDVEEYFDYLHTIKYVEYFRN